MMTLHLHHLTGCAPAPLAHYLKAIGILRIVAQQKDPGALGFWRDEHFCLVSSLDHAALRAFFLDDYAPTAFVSPWNKGSGFYIANDPGLAPIERSTAPRFEPYRKAAAEARAGLSDCKKADEVVRALKAQTKSKKGAKPARSKDDPDYKKELAAAEREFKRRKADVYPPFMLAWRGPHREWMEAAMVLSADGSRRGPRCSAPAETTGASTSPTRPCSAWATCSTCALPMARPAPSRARCSRPPCSRRPRRRSSRPRLDSSCLEAPVARTAPPVLTPGLA
jgi:hypothetical protein